MEERSESDRNWRESTSEECLASVVLVSSSSSSLFIGQATAAVKEKYILPVEAEQSAIRRSVCGHL